MDTLPNSSGIFKKLLLPPLWIAMTVTTLVLVMLLYTDKQKLDFYFNLAKQKPQRISSIVSYSLFAASSPPEGDVLGASVSSREGCNDILSGYLNWQGSVLANEAGTICSVSKERGIDPFFLTAIAGNESTFCKNTPQGSNNCWGWGVYPGSELRYPTLKDAIVAVADGLKAYADKGLVTVEEVENYYNPISQTIGHPWSSNVRYFMYEIRDFAASHS